MISIIISPVLFHDNSIDLFSSNSNIITYQYYTKENLMNNVRNQTNKSIPWLIGFFLIALAFTSNAQLTRVFPCNAIASTTQNNLVAGNAIDNNLSTRWSSLYSDPQWLVADVCSSQVITTIVIDWEVANANNYIIEGSNDPMFNTKTRLATRINQPVFGNHRIDSITLSTTGNFRYYRMWGNLRNTSFGYSIWEMRFYKSGIPCTRTITASATGSGTIVPSGAVVVNCGANQTFTFTPAPGFVVGSVIVNGANVGAPSSYTFNNVQANHTIIVNFITAPPPPSLLRVFPCSATASSTENGYVPANAIDNNPATRWSSLYSDPQWLVVDVCSSQTITTIVIDWETANAENYILEGSNDPSFNTKTRLATLVDQPLFGNHRIDSITLSTTGNFRYYRMWGNARNTNYGYSIWEIRFYKSGTTPPPPPPNQVFAVNAWASSVESALVATNAIDNDTSTRWGSAFSEPQWIIFDLGSQHSIDSVIINWEVASASDYILEGSNDASFASKTRLATVTGNTDNSNHRIDVLAGLTGSYQFYRLWLNDRNGPWGFSIFEVLFFE
jgi:hypothetical protein